MNKENSQNVIKVLYNFVINSIRKLKNCIFKFLFVLYSIRNYFTKRPVWFFYTNKDLIYKSEQIIKTLKLKNNISVLDLGCGNGIMLQPYLKITRPENIYGVDISYINIHQCLINLKGVPRNNLIDENIENYIKQTNRTFDVIILHGVIGYFTNEKQDVIIENCIKRLNKNGYLILGSINFVNDKFVFQTYPIQDVSFFDKLSEQYNVEYKIYEDKEWELTPKYHSRNVVIKKI